MALVNGWRILPSGYDQIQSNTNKTVESETASWYSSQWQLLTERRFTVTVEDRWFGVEELAEYLGVSRDTIYVWLTKGAVPGHRIGKLWKFKREEIDEWVKAGHAAAASVPRRPDDAPLPAKRRRTRPSKAKP
jgi:excisionase family DNA binding protein